MRQLSRPNTAETKAAPCSFMREAKRLKALRDRFLGIAHEFKTSVC